jgi:hypothetical protein
MSATSAAVRCSYPGSRPTSESESSGVERPVWENMGESGGGRVDEAVLVLSGGGRAGGSVCTPASTVSGFCSESMRERVGEDKLRPLGPDGRDWRGEACEVGERGSAPEERSE